MSEVGHTAERGHPTPLTYVKVALTLSAITGIEVGLFYIDMVPALFVACFFILSATKFVMVALFYMHLRYEARLFSTLFFGGVVLALIVVVSVLAIFGVLLVDPTRESQDQIKSGSEHAKTVIEQPSAMVSLSGGSIDGMSLVLPPTSTLSISTVHGDRIPGPSVVL
jgi:cytochrome c oxidase subunit 4